MKPERWRQIDQLLDAALELDPGQRAGFLDQACAGRGQLRREVESLLEAHGRAGSFIEAPALEIAAQLLAAEKESSRPAPGPVRGGPSSNPTPAQGSAAGRVSSPGLSSTQILAHRFKIVRFLARGGMGEVYEAEDLELGKQVALKTVRPGIARDGRALKRFKREVHLARKVTHPNACRIFDIFHHPVQPAEGAMGSEETITFLTMELLSGETLAERLRREGPVTTSEALPIISQMAAALTAAHEAGVIHRDFKSANVVLVPLKEGGEGARAVVTDFGLARASVGSESSTAIMGTPAYMAPEQLEDGEITPAADIYALGVVMYEMITGTLPFTGDSTFAVAFKRLKEMPPSLRTYVPDLDPKWEGVILRCLERDPANRFRSAADVPKALGVVLRYPL